VADDLRYTGTVRAAEVSYPRGGRWTMPVFVVFCAGWFAWDTDFYWPVAGIWAVVIASALANAWKLNRRGYQLFQAMPLGIVFGLDPVLRVPWRQIQELRISAMGRGTLLEILLVPSAPVLYRSLLRQMADLPVAQFWPSRRRRPYLPTLALPRRNPARYLVPLLEIGPAELRSELARLAPGTPILMIWA
jgi:hypothetical protein